ncbi:hypothetical protein ACHHYP_06271 [Achlya hypogyna]|uniref:Uncharacterized protein n=1 Tax=Achlya hypogyna TaxID=1202772 RepID=A0A1V9YV82_ACHHY|nr:hypothetical protein ACHHYP_06271 [Achlya hypogyna]
MNWFRNPGKALYEAACEGKESEVARLVQKGAPIEWTDKIGDTPLCCAARLGRDGVVQQLIAAGANVHHKRSFWLCTPLHSAANDGHVTTVRLLIAAGADVNAVDNVRCEHDTAHHALGQDNATPLHLASREGKDTMALTPESKLTSASTSVWTYR